MNDIQIFNYNSNQIRTVQRNGEPWFVLKDVCEVLGLSNSRMIADRLDEDEKGVSQIDTLGGKQGLTIINESGLYHVILRSDKPEAGPFRKWVTSEVLPSIRKTGSYATPTAQHRRTDRELEAADKRAAAMLLNAKSRVADKLQKLYDRAGVKAEYQAQALSGFYATDGIDLPRIALQGTKVTYDKGTIAKKIGVLSSSGNPHALAIGAIISQLDIKPNEVEAVPFQRNGHDGTDNQYTESVIAKVRLWLERNDFPEKIECGGKTYKVFYRIKE